MFLWNYAWNDMIIGEDLGGVNVGCDVVDEGSDVKVEISKSDVSKGYKYCDLKD
jgi:hypothetical protein